MPISTRTQASFERMRSEEHTSELQSQSNLVCRLLLEKKNRVVYNQRVPFAAAERAARSGPSVRQPLHARLVDARPCAGPRLGVDLGAAAALAAVLGPLAITPRAAGETAARCTGNGRSARRACLQRRYTPNAAVHCRVLPP